MLVVLAQYSDNKVISTLESSCGLKKLSVFSSSVMIIAAIDQDENLLVWNITNLSLIIKRNLKWLKDI